MEIGEGVSILLLGASGLCGSCIKEYLSKKGYRVTGTYHRMCGEYEKDSSMIQFSVEDGEKIQAILRSSAPQVIISCLRGQFQRQLEIYKILSEYVSKSESRRLIYFSTANVFDGAQGCVHYEMDETKAVSLYGRFKRDCEKLLQEKLGKQAVILRISMVWDRDCPRLKEWEQNILSHRSQTVYKNYFLNLTVPEQIARYICNILSRDLTGIFHVGTLDTIEHIELYRQLMEKWKGRDVKLQIGEELSKPEYLAVLPSREDVPKELDWKIQQVIDIVKGRQPM